VPKTHDWLTTAEAAAKLGVPSTTVYFWCKYYGLDAKQQGRDYLIHPTTLDGWCAQNAQRVKSAQIRTTQGVLDL